MRWFCPDCGWSEANSHPEPCAICHTMMTDADGAIDMNSRRNIEFIGGPLDGEVRDISPARIEYDPKPLPEGAARYEWRRLADGRRVMVFVGTTSPLE